MSTSLISLRNFHTNAKPENLRGFIPDQSTANLGVSYDTSNPDSPCIELVSTTGHQDQFLTYSIRLAAGSYVYAAYVVSEQASLNVLRVVTRDGAGAYREIAWTAYKGMGVHKVPFTLAEPTTVYLRLQAPKVQGLSASYRRLIVCAAAAYEQLEQAHEQGVLEYPWFDYATMPLSGGGLS